MIREFPARGRRALIARIVAEFTRIRAVWLEQAFFQSVATLATKSENDDAI